MTKTNHDKAHSWQKLAMEAKGEGCSREKGKGSPESSVAIMTGVFPPLDWLPASPPPLARCACMALRAGGKGRKRTRGLVMENFRGVIYLHQPGGKTLQ